MFLAGVEAPVRQPPGRSQDILSSSYAGGSLLDNSRAAVSTLSRSVSAVKQMPGDAFPHFHKVQTPDVG